MKRLLCALLVCAALGGMVPAARAETVTGSTTAARTFYVRADSGTAFIVLGSSTGVASVAQHNALGVYTGTGQEKHHGFYRITRRGNGASDARDWAPSATTNKDRAETCDEIRISFPAAGEYEIRVEPISEWAYWRVDSINYWVHDATWMVTIASGCTVYAGRPPQDITPKPQQSGIQSYPARGYQVWLKNPSVERIRPQCGPGWDYQVFASMNGSTKLYKPGQITWMEVRFVTGSWAYVEFGYSDGKPRGGFFEKSLFNSSRSWNYIPVCDLQNGVYGRTLTGVTPYNGPGYEYGSYSSCSLSAYESVYVCLEHNDWYYCRFYNDHGNNYGNVWLWIPKACVGF